MPHEYMDWIIKGAASLIFLRGIKILDGIKNSIEKLNKQMSTVIERTVHHTKEIDRLDRRIAKVEEKV